MTKVYSFKINEEYKKSFKYYLNEIPINLRGVILNFRNISDQYRSLAGKLLIRFALFEEGYGKNILLSCKRDIHNRPYLNQQLDFNISHSGDYVICSITDNGRLGVDIEKMELIEIESFFFLFRESEIKEIDNQLENFYELWTQKEALSKAIGKGLSINLKDILIENGIGFYRTDFWKLKSLIFEEDYMFNLAYQDNFEPKFYRINNSDLIIR